MRIFSNRRVVKAVTGLTKEEFYELVPVFSQALVEYRLALRPKRIRKLGGGRKGNLPTDEIRLLFILLYVKLYPTYDALSVLTGHCRSKCGDSVKLLLPALENALGRRLVLPARDGYKLEEILKAHPEIKDVFVDGTERRVKKPKNLRSRDKLYSGKRKAQTRKSLVVSDEHRFIHGLMQAKSGRRHDKRIFDKNHLGHHIPADVTIWTDTGFVGIQKQHPSTVFPKKATKKRPLTQEEKEVNRTVASIRVVAEHAIGGMKRFRSAADIYRNRLPNMDDHLMRVAAGLWNFHLQHLGFR